ncbi:pyocin S6 family toxin immunity protein [Pseudomonas sp. LB1P83]
MRYLSITGFYPEKKQDDSLQFQLTIKDYEMNQTLAQLTESKKLEDIEPGELELTGAQLLQVAKLLKVDFPEGLEYFIGARAAP